MNTKVEKLQAKLDGLAQKKAELVKQRDTAKVEIEQQKKQAGFDLLNGGTIDAIGGNLQKAKGRIETIESGINACAITMTEIEQEIQTAKTEWASERSKEVSIHADKVLNEVVNTFVELTIKVKDLKDSVAEVRSLASNYRAPIGGKAAKDNIGFLWVNLQLIIDQLKVVDPSIKDKVQRLI